jgi:hypothetical protein
MRSRVFFWFDGDRQETGATLCENMTPGTLIHANAHTTARKS